MTSSTSVHSSVGRVRQATVLLARLEAAESSSITTTIESCFALWQTIAAKDGGRFERQSQLTALVVFGLPPAPEGEPEPAIRVALEMQAVVRQHQQPGVTFLAHLGVSLGAITFQVTRQSNREQLTVAGDALLMAQRLEQLAPGQGVLVSHDAFRFVRGVFIAEEGEAIASPGRLHPVRTYLVRSLKPRAFRTPVFGIEGIEPPMIGREAEFGQLQAMFLEVMHSGRGQMVTVVGEPGIGKSRMYYELNNWTELRPERLWLFRARALPETRNVPYGVIRDLIAFRFEILESDSAEVARHKLTQGMIQFTSRAGIAESQASIWAAFIGHLVGFDFSASPHLLGVLTDSAQLRFQAFQYFVELILAAASVQPVMILMGDLHYADSASLDLILHIARACQAVPVLIANFTRPSFYDQQPGWGNDLANHTRLDLKPLSVANTRQLAETLLTNVEGLSPQLVKLIVSNADGNPFHLEELIKILVADGVIVIDESGWRVQPNRLITLRVPPILSDVLQARLNLLSPAERSLLQRAAVIGRIFWDRPLLQMQDPTTHEPADSVELNHLLASLHEREMIYRQESSVFAGAVEYAFRHTLLWDVTYQSVPARARETFHAQIADWLTEAATANGRLTEVLTIIADHYLQAGRPQQAIDFLTLAGDHAAQLSAFAEAQKFYSQALAQIASVGSHRVKLLLKLGDINAQLGSYPEAELYLETVLMLARGMGDNDDVAAALYQLGLLAINQGDFVQANARLSESLAIARQQKEPNTLARVLYGLGDLSWRLSQHQSAQAYLQESLTLARNANNANLMLYNLNRLGAVKIRIGDFAGAREHWHEGRQLAEQVGNRERLATLISNLGKVEFEEGHFEQARQLYLEGLAMAQQSGIRQAEVLLFLNLSDVSTSMNDLAQAQDYAEAALHLATSLGAVPYVLVSFINFARIRAATNDLQGALELLGFALNHPAADINTRTNAAAVLQALESRLGLASVEAGLARGQQLDFGEVIKKLSREA
jgi:predicted ATPase/class 3 adenylate cyclase